MTTAQEATPSVAVDVTYNFSDAYAANLQYYYGKPSVRWTSALGVVSAVALIYMAVVRLPANAELATSLLWTWLQACCGYCLISAVRFPFFLHSSTKRTFAALKPGHDQSLFIFAPEGYSITTAGARAERLWSDVYAVEELRAAFLIAWAPSDAFVSIPKRCFRSEADIQAFRWIVRQAMGAKAKLKD